MELHRNYLCTLYDSMLTCAHCMIACGPVHTVLQATESWEKPGNEASRRDVRMKVASYPTMHILTSLATGAYERHDPASNKF